MRIAFAGSGAFGIPALEALVRRGQSPVAVIAQPPKPVGRKQELSHSPLGKRALELGLAVETPDRINTRAAREWLSARTPDVLIVVAYGQILRPKLLGLPPLGCWNIHGSLLPRHRGASPIQAAILAGDATSGVSIQQMDEGLDSGPILAERATDIRPFETAGELHDRLAGLGAELLLDLLDRAAKEPLTPKPQDQASATHCGLITKSDGLIDWTRPKDRWLCHQRAMTPWPGAFTLLPLAGGHERVVILRATNAEGLGTPGEVLQASEGRLVIATGEGAIAPTLLQRAGKKPLPIADFLRGNQVLLGARCESPQEAE